MLSLGRASLPAGAALSDYQPTLYLSGTPSTVVSGAYQLVNGQGVSTTARPAPTATVFCNNNCVPTAGSLANGAISFGYSYRYTLVDANGGETAPSPSITASSVHFGEITVGNLPTGVTVRIYRDPTTGNNNGPWKRVVELPNNASSTYLDNIPDTSLGALLPQSQTRTATFAGTGYYEWIPGNGNPTSLTSGNFPTPQPPSPVFDGKGWVVDHAGGVSFAAGTWAITVKITSAGSADVRRWPRHRDVEGGRLRRRRRLSARRPDVLVHSELPQQRPRREPERRQHLHRRGDDDGDRQQPLAAGVQARSEPASVRPVLAPSDG